MWRYGFLLLFLSSATADHCDRLTLTDPLTLRTDQLTVLISGYSESRISLLSSLASFYSSHPSVAAVLILWGNPSTPPSALSTLLSGEGTAPISLHRHPSSSLNARFLPRAAIRTRAVAVCDDDVELHPGSLSFAFAVWKSRENSLIGFFARSHDLDLKTRSWIYTVHPDRYSIVLTKFMIFKTEYLYRYSCWNRLREARELVESERNCEDILMNFVVAMESGEAPVLVQGRRVRDYGDPRNSGNGSSVDDGEGKGEIRRVGLSTRGYHRKKRGDCIREFHRMLGMMPLRYTYGKLVEGVGEQGLCEKGGKLIFCDRE